MACMGTKHPMSNSKYPKDHMEIDKDEHSTVSNTDLLCAFPPEFANTQDSAKKISILRHLLEKDLKAVDLKWSFFVAACNTYRYDTCLRPFPPMYIKNEWKDIEALRKVVEITPPLAVLSQHLHDSDVYQHYGAIIELLYWVLVRLRDPYIKSLNKTDYDSVLKKVPSEMQVTPPNLIFQIVNTKQSMSAERWKTASQGYSTFHAYHGSRLENFHSIIHYGLQQNMCKKSVFGEGIYLSSELGVSLPYSPTGYGWGGSCLGAEIACVALCELFHHPDVKKGDSDNNAQSVTLNPMNGNVPNKYYLVTNSELVKVRYLLIYCQEVPTRRINNSGVLSWLKQHKLVTLVFTYVVLLASVGLTHNKQMVKYYKFFAQKAGLE